MISHVHCASTFGVDAHIITVETHIGGGGPKFNLVGLPDRAVSEGFQRILAATKNTGAHFPGNRITVNLAPADVPKEGSAFDLPIAVGILAGSSQIPKEKLHDTLIIGELALDGKLRPARGILPITVEAKKAGLRHVLLPKENCDEASVVQGITIHGFDHLGEVLEWFSGKDQAFVYKKDAQKLEPGTPTDAALDFSDVKGQENVKRAMEVAAAGGHNVIMVGPPGSGKTMLARRLPSILPPMTLEESLQTTKIHSVAGLLPKGKGLVEQRPFRAPHHTVSDVALVGGGSIPMPGEISLGHNGILFLDELPEFKRSALEVLRQPLEDGFVTISRARMTVSYPSKIMLVASMNPSPAGDWFDPREADQQARMSMHRYMGKISGPLLDRIDLHIEVNRVSFEELSGTSRQESSHAIRERVMKAREIQKKRFEKVEGVFCNAQMSTRMVREVCQIDDAGKAILKRAINSLNLSARAYDRILKVARTIADLDHAPSIAAIHMAEAIQYRNLDREGWLG